MARRTQQQWQALIEEQQHSGETAAAFCKARGINDKYFSSMKSKLRADSKGAGFLRVATPAPRGEIVLSCAAVTLRLPSSCHPEWLAALVRELR